MYRRDKGSKGVVQLCPKRLAPKVHLLEAIIFRHTNFGHRHRKLLDLLRATEITVGNPEIKVLHIDVLHHFCDDNCRPPHTSIRVSLIKVSGSQVTF